MRSKDEGLTKESVEQSIPTHHPVQHALDGRPEGIYRTEEEERALISDLRPDEPTYQELLVPHGPLSALADFCYMPNLTGVRLTAMEWRKMQNILTQLRAKTFIFKITGEKIDRNFRLWWFLYGPGQKGELIQVPHFIISVWHNFLAQERRDPEWVERFEQKFPTWYQEITEDPVKFAQKHYVYRHAELEVKKRERVDKTYYRHGISPFVK
jgi:hypothetical protein